MTIAQDIVETSPYRPANGTPIRQWLESQGAAYTHSFSGNAFFECADGSRLAFNRATHILRAMPPLDIDHRCGRHF